MPKREQVLTYMLDVQVKEKLVHVVMPRYVNKKNFTAQKSCVSMFNSLNSSRILTKFFLRLIRQASKSLFLMLKFVACTHLPSGMYVFNYFIRSMYGFVSFIRTLRIKLFVRVCFCYWCEACLSLFLLFVRQVRYE